MIYWQYLGGGETVSVHLKVDLVNERFGIPDLARPDLMSLAAITVLLAII
jgi:hypothetical protein